MFQASEFIGSHIHLLKKFRSNVISDRLIAYPPKRVVTSPCAVAVSVMACTGCQIFLILEIKCCIC